MEMHSEKFKERIKDMLTDKNTIVIGTVAAPRYGHVVPLAEQIKKNHRVHVYHIKKSTRENVLDQFKLDVVNYLKKHERKILTLEKNSAIQVKTKKMLHDIYANKNTKTKKRNIINSLPSSYFRSNPFVLALATIS